MIKLPLGAPRPRALHLAVLSVLLGWFCTVAPAQAKNFLVTDYGIGTDGINDYTLKIQALLTTAAQYPGSTVTFPAGTYIVSDLLNANGIKLVGQTATLSMSGTGEGGYVALTGIKPSLQNFTITYNGSPSELGGVYSNGQNASVTGCSFYGWPREAVMFDGTTGSSTVSGNTFNVPVEGDGLVLSETKMEVQKVTVTGNTFNGPTSYSVGILVIGPNALIATQNSFSNLNFGIDCEDPSFLGTASATYNTFSNCGYGAQAQGLDSLTFSNNSVEAGYEGITEFGNGSAVINDNSLNMFSGIATGIDSENGMDGTTVKGNTVIGSETGIFIDLDYSVTASTNNINSTGTAIQMMTVGTTANLTNNFINNCATGISDQNSTSVTAQNNSISNASGEAISLSGNSGTDTVAGNTLSNIGTAGGVNAAIDIESPSATVSVTGNTYNQTSPYDTVATEPQYYLYLSAGSLTIKNNKTNTILPNFLS